MMSTLRGLLADPIMAALFAYFIVALGMVACDPGKPHPAWKKVEAPREDLDCWQHSGTPEVVCVDANPV